MDHAFFAGEEDAFWRIALDNEGESLLLESTDDSSADWTCVFELIFPSPYGTLQCRLIALPLPMGTEQSTGAQAWYGSALLSALLLQSPCLDDRRNRIHQHIHDHICRRYSDLCILELGSGAVGLAGIVAGFAISGYIRTIFPLDEVSSCRVYLTDRDPPVLQQLEQNVSYNKVQWMKRFPKSNLPEFIVQSLDWKDGWNGTKPQLVIGSELVYNTETAKACVFMVLQLLYEYPDLLVVLVQVTHRDGWNDVFLPALRQGAGVVSQEVLSHDLHQEAAKLVAPGGTASPVRFYLVLYYQRLASKDLNFSTISLRLLGGNVSNHFQKIGPIFRSRLFRKPSRVPTDIGLLRRPVQFHPTHEFGI